MAPTAVLMGPGISKHDAGWIQEFLKVSKEYGVLPDIVSWHEDGLKHDISGHVGGMVENFWQDGTNVPRIVISPNAAIENREEAGDPAIFLAQIEKSARDQAWRPVTQQFQFKLTHLFTNELRPHSNYYTYRQYVSLAANGGRCVKLNGSDTVEGLAVWNAQPRTVKVLLGRNRSRVDANRVLGTVTLHIRGAAGATLHVRGTRIVNSGGKPAEAPDVTFEKDFPLKDDRADIPLPNFASGDAYSLEIIVRGSPATAATKPTSQKSPTTRLTSAPSANKSASPK
jgi:hypothetical protein